MPVRYINGVATEVRPYSSDSSLTSGLKAGGAGLLADVGSLGAALGLDTQDFANRWRTTSGEYAANAPVSTFEQVQGLGDLGSYLAYNVGQSAPFAATMLVPGLGAGAAASRLGLSTAGKAATELAAAGGAEGLATRAALEEAAKQIAIRRAATGGAVAGGTLQGAGDIAGSQYEEAGAYDRGTIAKYAPIYGALGFFLGPEAMLARGATGGTFLPKSVLGATERIAARTGIPGAAQRAGLGAVAAAPMEALSETGQEVINQLGRMAVSPTATLTSGEAPSRYKESAIAGALLGGVFGGAGGAFTKPYTADKEAIAKRVDQLMQDQEAISYGMKTNAEDIASAVARQTEGEKVKEGAAKTRRVDTALAAPAGKDVVSGFNEMSFLANQVIEGRKARQEAIMQNLETLTAPTPPAPVQADPVSRFIEGALGELPTKGAEQFYTPTLDFLTLSDRQQREMLNDLATRPSKAPKNAAYNKDRVLLNALLSGLAAAPELDRVTTPARAPMQPRPVEASGFANLNTIAQELTAQRKRQQDLEAEQRAREVAAAEQELNAFDLKYAEQMPTVTPVEPEVDTTTDETAAQLEALIPERKTAQPPVEAVPTPVVETTPAPVEKKLTPPTAPHPKYAKYMTQLGKIGDELASLQVRLAQPGKATAKAAMRIRRGELEAARSRLENALEGKDVVQPATGVAQPKEVIHADTTQEAGKDAVPVSEGQKAGQEEALLAPPPAAATEPVAPKPRKKGEQYAVQVEGAGTRLPRGEGPEVGLQEVGQGNAHPEVAAEEGKAPEKVADTRTDAELTRDLETAQDALVAAKDRALDDETAIPEVKALTKEIAHIKGERLRRVQLPKENLPEAREMAEGIGTPVEGGVREAEAPLLSPEKRAEEDDRFFLVSDQTPVNRSMLQVLQDSPTGDSVLTHIETIGNKLEQYVAKWLRSLGADTITVSYTGTEKTGPLPDSRVLGSYSAGVVEINQHGERAPVLLHELLHAVTHNVVTIMQSFSEKLAATPENKREALLNSQSKEDRAKWHAYTQLESLMGTARDNLTGFDYALSNMHEFISEAHSNLEFQFALMDTQIDVSDMGSPSLWARLVTLLRDLLGLNPPDNSVLSAVLEATPRLAEPFLGSTGNTTTYFSMGGGINDHSNTPSNLSEAVLKVQDLATRVAKTAGAAATETLQTFRGESPFVATPQQRAREWKRKGSQIIQDALHEVSTMREYASFSRGFAQLLGTVDEYNQLKDKLRGQSNEKMSTVFSRQLDKHPEDRAMVTDMLIATTLIKGDVNLDSFMVSYIDQGKKVYHVDEEGRAVPDPKLVKMGMFTKEEFAAGIAAHAYGEVKFEHVVGDARKELVWKAYENTVYANFQAAAEFLRGQQASQTQMITGHVKLATREMSKDAATQRELMQLFKELKDAHEAIYRKGERHTPGSKKAIEISKESLDNAENMRNLVHAMLRGQDTPADIVNLAKMISSPKATEAELKAAETRLQKWHEKIVAPTWNNGKAFSTYEADKFTHEEMVAVADGSVALREQEYYAIQSIAGGYVPFSQHGEYFTRMKYVDEQGQEVRATDEYNRLLMHRRSDDVESLLRPLADQWNKDWPADKKDSWMMVPTQELDKEGKGDQGMTKVRIVMSDPAHIKAQQVSTRTNYDAMQVTMAALGMKMPPEMREALTKAMSKSDAFARHNLKRQGHPGFSTNFRQSISEHLSQRAAMTALKTHQSTIDMIVGSDIGTNPEMWGVGIKEIGGLKEAYLNAVKTHGANSSAAKMAHRALMSTAQSYYGQHKAVAAEMKAALTPGNTSLATRAQKLRAESDDFVRLNRERYKDAAAKYALWFYKEGALEDPTHWRAMKSAVTVAQLGMSFASAATNISSLPLHTFSALASYNPETGFGGGFGARASSAAIIKAIKALSPIMGQTAWQGIKGNITFPEDYMRTMIGKAEASPDGMADGYSTASWKFLLDMSERGVLSAQRYNEMMGQANRPVYGDLYGRTTSRMMAMFSATEEMNRMATALASHELFKVQAVDSGMVEGSAELDAHLHEQVSKMVYSTQGNYNMSNRPRLFRGDVSSIIFMYKTFAVTSVELLKNMPPKGRAIFLGMLWMAAGTDGLPFWEELTALMDFITQKSGLGAGVTKGNSERELRIWLKEMGIEEVVMQGALDSLTGTHFFGRAGISIGVPGIALGRAGTTFEAELGKAVGPAAGFAKGLYDASGSLLHGDLETMMRQLPVTGVRNMADAYSYWNYGAALNKRGQMVVKDVSAKDIVARALGYYPQELQEANNDVKLETYTKNYAKQLSTRFLEEYSKATILHDGERKRELLAEVREHNDTFRGTSLYISDFTKKADAKAKEASKSLWERTVKGLPKAQREELLAAGMD